MTRDVNTRKEFVHQYLGVCFQENFERMTKEPTAFCSIRDEIEVVGPFDGNIILYTTLMYCTSQVPLVKMPADSTTVFLEVRRFTTAKRSTPVSCCQQHGLLQGISGRTTRELISARIVRRAVLAGGATNFQRIGEHAAKEPTASAPSTMFFLMSFLNEEAHGVGLMNVFPVFCIFQLPRR